MISINKDIRNERTRDKQRISLHITLIIAVMKSLVSSNCCFKFILFTIFV